MNTIIILVFGFWLAIADWAAIDVSKMYGRTKGLSLWMIAVLFPLIAVVILCPWKVSLGAISLSVLLSGTAYWFKQQEKLGARASRFYRFF